MIKFWLQPIAHTSLFGKPETKGSPATKGLAGAVATIPEVTMPTVRIVARTISTSTIYQNFFLPFNLR